MALSKSERINLIQSAAQALADLGLTDARLVLDTFEIEDIDWEGGLYWSSDGYGYSIQRLVPVSDEILIGLNAHFSGEGAQQAADAVAQIGSWRDDHRRVFLSHTADNRKVAGEIRSKLLLEGLDVFVAHDRIETNQEWIEEIKVALATCEVMVALFSDAFASSNWCDQEVGVAVGRGIDIISIKYGADPHGFVYPKQGFEAGPDDPDAASRIAKEVCRIVKGEEPSSIPDPAAASVRKYARSHSFDQARENLGKLMKLRPADWTPGLVELAMESGKNNGQLSAAWYYEELVPDALIAHLEDIGVLPARGPQSSVSPVQPADDPLF